MILHRKTKKKEKVKAKRMVLAMRHQGMKVMRTGNKMMKRATEKA